MHPEPTTRLRFREMVTEDLDDMADLLGDPDVMEFYPSPKSREEAQAWIEWNRRSYRDNGFGLWIIELVTTGEFVGDCGLTWQVVEGERLLEVGYHVVPKHQGNGYATEAASQCLRHGLDVLGATQVAAIINPDNAPSRRVAERIGMSVIKSARDKGGLPVVVYGCSRGPGRSFRGDW